MTTARSLWAHDNLIAYCVVPFDANRRGPEERAQMLARLGFKHFGYDWRPEHIPTFDAEIEALQQHGVNLDAWWFSHDPADAQARDTLELFKRHGVAPQLWVMQSTKDFPRTPEQWQQWMPHGTTGHEALLQGFARFIEADMPTTPREHEQRIEREADRIEALVQLAAPYGCKVKLYNHNGWFGIMENQLAIRERLRGRGVTDVGLVYNFSHARDWFHDDTVDFPALWSAIEPYVDVVNVAGTHSENGTALLPGDGDSELEMMRTIAASGWTGRVGVIAESGGDAEITLGTCLARLDRLVAQLEEVSA